MDDFLSIFAAELSNKMNFEYLNPIDNMVERIAKPRTILQLNSTPFSIDVNEYSNPHSSDNPTGDYRAAYRLSRLADPIPELETYYTDSLNSSEKVWGNIINSATTENQYILSLLSKSQLDYNTSQMSGMGGIPNSWLPVEIIPSNWYELVKDESKLIKMEIDTSSNAENNDFIIINGDKGISLNIINMNDSKSEINLNTTINKIYVDVLRVDFIRNWLNFEILESSQWSIAGLEKGYFSTGEINENNGIFPLIIKSILIGTKVTFEGNFDKKDIDAINKCKVNKSLSIGPFLLNTETEDVVVEEKKLLTSNVTQVIGYISELIPLCPGK
ncbi:hypothetical protein HYH39_17650 [Clostridium botulinum]|nr:hypothetical protein KU40_17270 [Clostridium botulinum]MBY6780747.1 hypothetical protein [Clostridium botulinum]MBY6853932.1 hypothetical protein [Clostridium botulinum]NFF24544.1 hypothetical protein [Clostridium botulinum]NFF36755.1 hypothetical protein [Clostridium botulinum]